MKARRRFYCHAFVTSEPACVALCSDVIEPWGSLDDDSRFEYLCRGSDKNWYAGQYKVLLYVLSPTVSFHYLASLVLLSHVLLLYSSNCLLYLEVHLKGGFQGQINIYLSNQGNHQGSLLCRTETGLEGQSSQYKPQTFGTASFLILEN